MNKAKIHTVYMTADGKRVPSVTTVLSELAKPALIHWAWNLGIKGLDYKVFRDELADVGSLAHRIILGDMKNETFVPDGDYTANQINLAENCFLKYLEWKRQHKVEPICVEEPLVSELYAYGGTPDFFGSVDDHLTLMDFKTGKALYDEHWYQIGALAQLIREKFNIVSIADFRLLNIGRDESEKFEEKQKSSVSKEFDLFLSTLRIYKLKKEIKHD
jgi:hypothetical protein